MYFSKKNMEPIQEETTSVWICSEDTCSCWMRENFSFEESPACPICSSVMVKNTKMLPSLLNHSTK
ncbi:cold-shock protein [Paenibacillus albiflavus]|uniref:Cold-shock protein n=1 Tax=Paenibacillus albiflavus TaxID=2545760 RepID=A0A4R4EAN9_9BACL|nr:cold-shock protein [Paenibacillus albiflavus]TCZ76347.1 cold-shock protein [Paenibacillus albiflavus]